MLGTDWICSSRDALLNLQCHLIEQKRRAENIAQQINPVALGYFRAEEDDEIQSLLVSYRTTRQALLDLIGDCRLVDQTANNDDDYNAPFLLAFAAACMLVDAARFLRAVTKDRPVVRRKLNEPVPLFDVPGGTYDTIQKSLMSSRNAWRLYRAMQYFDRRQSLLDEYATRRHLQEVLQIARRLRDRLDVSANVFATANLRTRSDRWLRRAGRNLVSRTTYAAQKLVSEMMSDVYIREGHQPVLPVAIIQQLATCIQPGDVLVVRKDYALTNYFLPGYWPHAALYLGPAEQLEQLVLDNLPSGALREPQISELSGEPMVLEALKDGVHLRSWKSPLSSDSLVLLRPQLDRESIAKGLARVLRHVGKPYDFDFNFAKSDRLVCTEVIYRAYDGLQGISFPLKTRVGRPNLSGTDLIELAFLRQWLLPVCCYAPRYETKLVEGDAVEAILRAAIQRAPRPQEPRRDLEQL